MFTFASVLKDTKRKMRQSFKKNIFCALFQFLAWENSVNFHKKRKLLIEKLSFGA